MTFRTEKREYQVTIDFEMDEYDFTQEGDQMIDTLRRIVKSHTNETPLIRVEKGAVVE